MISSAVVVGLALFRERARSGIPFYAFAFALPCAVFAFLLYSADLHLGGLGWPPNILLGAPRIAACAGLLVAFCYQPPLVQGERRATQRLRLREPMETPG